MEQSPPYLRRACLHCSRIAANRSAGIALRLVGLVCLAACTPVVPLRDVPVEGGSKAQRDAAADTLARFDNWTDGLVGLSKVLFTEIDPDHAGSFRKSTDVVRLSEGLEVSEVPQVLRHELCHAVWFQMHLDDVEDGLSADVERILADGTHPLHDVLVSYPERFRATELFASVCEHIPARVYLIASPCPGASAGTRTAAEWTIREAYRGHTGLGPERVSAVPLGEAPTTWPEGYPLAAPPVDGRGLTIAVAGEGLPEYTTIDLRTGPLAVTSPQLDTTALQTALPVPPPFGVPVQSYTPLEAAARAHTAVKGDRALIVTSPFRALVGEKRWSRLLWLEEGTWTPVGGACYDGEVVVFATDDTFGTVAMHTMNGSFTWSALR